MLKLKELDKALVAIMSNTESVVLLIRESDEKKARAALEKAQNLYFSLKSNERSDCHVQQIENALCDYGLKVNVDCVLYVCENV